MVGVPKSNRCTFCRSRKTKCDENWPTCGTCAKAGRKCSGARKRLKFVVNGSHNETPTSPTEEIMVKSAVGRANNGERHSVRPEKAVVGLKGYSKGGCNYRRMRLSEPHVAKPAQLPSMSPVDRLAARLASCLEAAPGTGHDLAILGSSLKLLPRQLSSDSIALQDAVELVISSWTNSRQGLPPAMWLDAWAYDRALRSLHTSLNDPNPGSLNDTFAAQALLQKVEIVYDFERGCNQENHAAGLTAVINRGGPQQSFTDLALHITFESFFNMIQEDVRLGRECIFIAPEWRSALTRALDASTVQPICKHLYRLWIELAAWPTLVGVVRSLRRYPTDTMLAAELILRGMPVAEYFTHEAESTITSLMRSGDIIEVENTECPGLFPSCYEFSNYDVSKYFYFHAMFSIIVCRTLEKAHEVLGNDVTFSEKRCRKMSERIWMSYAWMRNQRPLAVEFTAALAFSYESATTWEERDFCVASLEVMEEFRRPPPIGRWTEPTILANAKGYTGRCSFIKTQDVNIEIQGLGCRY